MRWRWTRAATFTRAAGFTTAGGVSANKVAKWNGSSWSALGSGMNSTVRALARTRAATSTQRRVHHRRRGECQPRRQVEQQRLGRYLRRQLHQLTDDPTNGTYASCANTVSGGTCALSCDAGYTKSGDALCTDGRWSTQTCNVAACPANASGAPNCDCDSGYTGTLAWNGSSWTDTCTADTPTVAPTRTATATPTSTNTPTATPTRTATNPATTPQQRRSRPRTPRRRHRPRLRPRRPRTRRPTPPTATSTPTNTATKTPTRVADRDGHASPPPPATCGNGIVDPGEQCDDGNTTSGDCCSATCQAENLGSTTCGVGACERTVPRCVNGISQACVPGTPAPETCNGIDDDCDGQIDQGLGSTTCGVGACTRTVQNCVNGVPQTCTPGTPGVEGPAGSPSCNNGIDDDCDGLTDASDPGCQLACGNGVLDPGEQCDDGNTASGDGCSATCQSELISGGGSVATDCEHEWQAALVPARNSKGMPMNRQACTDGDPTCDFGPAGDNACTFHVAMCFNVTEQRFTCTPTDVARVQLLQPSEAQPNDATAMANRDALETALEGLQGAGARPVHATPAEGWTALPGEC